MVDGVAPVVPGRKGRRPVLLFGNPAARANDLVPERADAPGLLNAGGHVIPAVNRPPVLGAVGASDLDGLDRRTAASDEE